LRILSRALRDGTIGIALLLCAAAARPQQEPARTTGSQTFSGTGKQLADRVIAALGGDRFLNMRYRLTTGRVYSFFRDQLSGFDVARIYTEYLPQAPAKGLALREREVLGKKQDYSYLFLPDQGWDITYRGARPVEDEKWDRYARSTENDIFYILKVRYKEPGMQFDYAGSDVYLGTHVEILDITDAQNRSVRVFVDHNTMLPFHQTFNWLDPQTRYRNDEASDFGKYRDIGGGIKWPFTIERERNGYKSYQMFATTMQADQAPPANTFDLPPGARVLKKMD
jgi:hypothetical protein